MAQRPTRRLAIALAAALWAMPHLSHADTDERARAEARLAELDREIGRLQGNLERARERRSDEQEALRALDLRLQESTREARKLEQSIRRTEQEIARLQGERSAYLEQISDRRDVLEKQLLAAWKLGRESRLKLMLNQDDPARLGRLLGYYDYFSDALAARIAELRTVLAGLDRLAAEIGDERERLAAVERRHRAARSELDAERRDKTRLIAELESTLTNDAGRLEELRRDRADLEQILQRLEDALADIPADLGGRLHPRALKGRLPMPVRGPVAAAFGQQRGAGLRWQGWLIGADPGAAIRGVAYGRVAYADWLRGYGLLLIIDHGDGFMSLYGNNEALLVEVGDWVQPGATIATVGSNAGQPQGLYFELRNNGNAVDPAVWVQRR